MIEARTSVHELRQKFIKSQDDVEQIRTLFKAKEEEADKYKRKYAEIYREMKTMKSKEKFIKEQVIQNQELQLTITQLRNHIEKVGVKLEKLKKLIT